MQIAISDPVLDLRAIEKVLLNRIDQEVQIIRALPMSSGAWQREKAQARKDAYDTALMDVGYPIFKVGTSPERTRSQIVLKG